MPLFTFVCKFDNFIIFLIFFCRSNASTPLGFASSHENGNFSEDYGYFTQSMSSLQISGRPDSRGSIGSNREAKGGSKKKKRLSESLEDSVLKSLKEEKEDNLLEDIEENNGLDLSSNSYLQKPLPKTGKNKRNRKPSGDSMLSVETIASRQGSVRPLPNLQKKNAFNASLSDKKSVINEKSELVQINDQEKPSICCCFRGKNKILPSCGRGEDTSDDQYEKKPLDNMDTKVPLDSTEYPIKDGQPPPDINIDISSDITKGMRGSVLSVQETVQSRRSSITTLKGGNSRAGTPALEGEATRSMRYVLFIYTCILVLDVLPFTDAV